MNPLGRVRALLKEVERRRARNSLAIYAGLHIPAEIERDDLPALHKLPIAARYIPAVHHRLLIEKLEAVERGEIKRLMILAPPGTAKSTYASSIFPAWYLGRHPEHDIIGASQTQELADRFGRRTRNLVGSEIHRNVFGCGLARDQRAAGAWQTERGGEYYATGVQPFAGRRGDGAVTDDLIRGRQDADSKLKRNSTWEWVLGDLRPRLKPNAWWVFITTRWHEDDPAGRILPADWDGRSGWVTARDGEKWYVLCFVAVIETPEERDADPLHRKMGEIIWPEWFTKAMLAQERRSQGTRNWNALYQQKPRPDEGSVLKRAHWRLWPHEKLPKCEFIMSVYDTAFEVGEEDDYSARTTWGVFEYEEPRDGDTPLLGPHRRGSRMCAILLEAWQDKVEFPELRKLAQEHYKRNPLKLKIDVVLIEKKVSGHSLIQELRRAGVPARGIPAKESKLLRAHAASVVFEDGCMFYPNRRWAEDVIERCAAATFIKGDPGNDMADTVVHAANRLRNTYHLQLRDEQDEEDEDQEPVKRRFYG